MHGHARDRRDVSLFSSDRISPRRLANFFKLVDANHPVGKDSADVGTAPHGLNDLYGTGGTRFQVPGVRCQKGRDAGHKSSG